MTAIARFGAIALDSDDPQGLAAFYRALLGFDLYYESDDLIVLQGEHMMLTVERVAGHRRPDWPSGEVPKQMHLDLFVSDLDASEHAAIEIGASKPDFQPAPDRWRVLVDPAGHPFCLTLPPRAKG
ncbi:VOC family protein [Nocardia sp. NPDC005978]|uniref:VOC family protein n=1 Tax=unclassified Nocardia TaxID=2637762 RepID=UPI0033A5549B